VAFAARASRRKAQDTDWKICEEELQIALALTISRPEPQESTSTDDPEENEIEEPFEDIFLKEMKKATVEEECKVCFDGVADHCLVPCGHTGLCQICVGRIDRCPFCKTEIMHAQKLWKV
jgi:hypothetical protein